MGHPFAFNIALQEMFTITEKAWYFLSKIFSAELNSFFFLKERL